MKNIPFLFIFTFTAIFAIACGQQPSSSSSSGTSSLNSGGPVQDYASGIVTNAWPGEIGDVVQSDDIFRNNFLVLLDNSGSMGTDDCGSRNLPDSRFRVAQNAIVQFSESISPSDNLALAVFNGGRAEVVVPFGYGETHRQNFRDVVYQQNDSEGTPLEQSVEDLRAVMTLQGKAQQGYGRYSLVVVTDGDSQDGNPSDEAIEIVEETPIEFHALGFCTGRGHDLNVDGYTIFTDASDPEKLMEAFLAAVETEGDSFDDSSFN